MISAHVSAMQNFNPRNIGGLLCWLEAGSLELTDNAEVTTWTDIGEGGNNATQSDSSLKPILKTGVLNGRDVVRFDGTKYLDLPASGISTNAFAGGTMFIVGKRSSYTQPFGQCEGSNNRGMVGSAFPAYAMYNNYFRNGISANPNFANTDFAIISSYGNRTASSQRDFYARIGFGTPSYRYLIGDIAEVIFYASELSTASRQKVEKYLSIKYAI